jgi:PAS domain S-box-containing protein
MIRKTVETPINILLVDDEPRNLTALESILDSPDYDLTKVQSGPEALMALLTGDFALLVLDIEMPGMKGWELAQLIKERKKTQHIPIIFLTAHYAEDEHIIQGYTAGAVDYLTKPVNPAILRSKVGVFVDLCRKAALEETNRSLQKEIAERQQAEEALQEQTVALENAAEGISRIHAGGCYVTINQAYAALCGYQPQELIGMKWEWTVLPADQQKLMAAYQKMLTQDKAEVEVRGVRKDSSVFYQQLVLVKANDRERRFTGHFCFMRDITERKQAEEQIKASLLEKEVLLKEIHHRVKNNMQVICSVLNLQSGYIRDAKALALFRESESRIRSMAMIHEKLYQNESLSRVDFSEYLSSLSSLLLTTYVANPAAVRLATRLDPVFLDIDTAVPLGLIVNELVSNSLKYAYPDGGSGVVELALRAGPENQYTLSVRDQGVGLPAGIDVNNTDTLGLYLVKILSAQLGAALSIESNGQGTIVEVTSKTNTKPEKVALKSTPGVHYDALAHLDC